MNPEAAVLDCYGEGAHTFRQMTAPPYRDCFIGIDPSATTAPAPDPTATRRCC